MEKTAPPKRSSNAPVPDAIDMARLEKAVERAIRERFAKAEREKPRARWGVRLLVAGALAGGIGLAAWKLDNLETKVEKISDESARMRARVDQTEKNVSELAETMSEILARMDGLVEGIQKIAEEVGYEREQESLIRCPEGGECK
ncbi:hypothetical protein JW721_00295 [Candidatus Micrarchaeota archaeon]|nr:hypothetical protein [Candidatus Micrarchaeota archaeon]